jgi:hypothetical protein
LNAGPAEEVGKVATSFIDAMRSQPSVLALIVVTFGMVGYVYYQGMSFEAARRENVASVIKMQADMSRLIAQCVQAPTP